MIYARVICDGSVEQKAHTHAYVRCSPFWDSFGWATGTKSNGESSIDDCKKSLSPSQVLVIPVELLVFFKKKKKKKERKKLARGNNDYISHVRHFYCVIDQQINDHTAKCNCKCKCNCTCKVTTRALAILHASVRGLEIF